MSNVDLEVLNIIRNKLNNGSIELDSKFEEIGLDSAMFVEAVVMLEAQLNFQFDDEYLDLERFVYVKDLCEYVEAKLA